MSIRSRFQAGSFLAVLVLSSCSHPDITGPTNTNYVHVIVLNGSSVSIVVPYTLQIGQFLSRAEIPPGMSAELSFIEPDLCSGSFTLVRSVSDLQQLAIIHFRFTDPPASKRGLAYATIRVVAEPSAPVSATSDRPDLLLVTGIDPH